MDEAFNIIQKPFLQKCYNPCALQSADHKNDRNALKNTYLRGFNVVFFRLKKRVVLDPQK